MTYYIALAIGGLPGALRGLSQTLRLASMFARASGNNVPTVTDIRDAWRDLGGAE